MYFNHILIFTVIEVKVSFKHSEYTVNESAGSVAITVQADRSHFYYYLSFCVKIKASINKHLNPYGNNILYLDTVTINVIMY